MDAPRTEIVAFVEVHCPGARVVPLTGDASARRFHRVVPREGPTRIVMDYGEPFEGETDDVRMARIFADARLPVAKVLDVGGFAGCLVLEDLGDRTMESVVRAGGTAAARAVERAVCLAAEIATRGTPALARSARRDGPALDSERLRFEMDFFIEHYAAGFRGLTASAELRATLHALADRAASTAGRVLCHRDFHSRNLMVRDDGSLAMVDIQDARWGPDSYDLASLLRDAYIELDEGRVESLIERYLGCLDDPPDTGAFRDRFDTVAAQRMIKALGTFGYQTGALGRQRYAESIPRTLERLRRLLPLNAATRDVHAALSAAGLLETP